METPNRVDVNEVCENIESITTRIMGMLPDKMFYTNYDVTRDNAEELHLLATLLRDSAKVLKDVSKDNWREHLEGVRYEFGNPIRKYQQRKALWYARAEDDHAE